MSQIYYNILHELLKKDNHIRGLAKDLFTNQTTIARKIKEMEEINIVDFRVEGKNKVYFIKSSIEADKHIKILEHLKLTELIQIQPKIRKIVDAINNEKEVKLALIFGSYAKKTNTKESDIDLYIETLNRKLKDRLSKLDSKLNIKIGLFEKENLLIKEIMKNHVIIKGVDRYYELIH
ncbi:hypothetical protein GOV08_01840 [Candidatus Woesearchaeota archaeon]|nr:hypothetical protein [Candidatus Woesearchaeota archaeon]